MKKWPLKLKVGAYCAVLTVLGLVATAGILLPSIYHHQLAELDDRLSDDAEELFRNLDNLPGTATDPRSPTGGKFVPPALRMRYIELTGRNGEVLYHSPNLRDASLRRLPDGMKTITLRGAGATVRASDDASAVDRDGEKRGSTQEIVQRILEALGLKGDRKLPIDRNCRIGTFHHGPFTLRVGTRLGTIESMQDDLRDGFFLALPIVALVIFVGGMVLARHALQPVSAMTAAAERISAQHPDERLPIPPAKDEIARLSMVLNASFDRLQRAYNSAARFSADASHQLKTPIAVLRAGLDEMKACDYLREEERETVTALLHQTRRLTTLVEDLLLLAQSDAGRLKLDPVPLDLVPVLDTLEDDLDALGSERGLQIERATPSQLMANADGRRVKIILQNLGENAVKYNRDGGRIRVAARRENGSVYVSVSNTGGTIPSEHRDRLFERFNRAGQGENIKGHGLGLNIARELARAHGGELSLKRSDAEWTEFELRLPAVA